MKFIIEFLGNEDEPGYDAHIAETRITTTLEDAPKDAICAGDCGGFAEHIIQIKNDGELQYYCDEHIDFWLVALLQPEEGVCGCEWDPDKVDNLPKYSGGRL